MRNRIAALALLVATGAPACGGSSARPGPVAQVAPTPVPSPRATRSTATRSTATARPVVAPEADWRRDYAARPALRALSGAASYYHDSLAGRSTASGEPYDPRAYTAASRDLPFGTVLRVVRPDTGASVIVRVNDRGPFGRRRRLIDLSRAAAEELGMIERGVVDVRAEVLEDGPPRRRR